MKIETEEFEMEKITRLEVIDYRKSKAQIDNAEDFGRIFVAYGVEIDLSIQDEERTLKIFIKKREGK